ncbi:MAG: BTAD domain-containing putative transcriptional regulator [Gammaproteobacteria bacterium]
MTTEPILSKLSMPRLANVYIRTRMFKCLDESRQRKVIWISAPAGSGKSTLVSSYIKEAELSSLWYQMDEGDNDIASFFYFMGQHPPLLDKPQLPLLTPEYLDNLPLFIRNYFRSLFKLVTPLNLLVFDNYQDLDKESLLNDLLPFGFAEAPQGISVVVISRSDPPPSFTRLRANAKLYLLNAEDILLTEAESIALGKFRYRQKFSSQQLLTVFRLTRGWVAGQILLLEQNKHGDKLPDLNNHSNLQIIFDYFATEIFNRSEPDIQNFLLKTALLKKFTPQAAEELSDSHQAEFVLESLNRRNFFTAKHAHPILMYEYHPLFRTFLMARLQQTFSAEHIISLQRSAAYVLANSGYINDAVCLLIAAKDWNKAISLILEHAKTFAEQGRGQTLQKWLLAVPQHELSPQPWCLYWLGLCHIPFDFFKARHYLEQSYALFKCVNNLTGLCLSWSGIVDSYIFQWGDFAPLDQWITEMDDLMSQHPTFPSAEIEIKVIAGFFSTMIYRCPEHPNREYCINKLEQFLIQSDDLFLRTQITNHLILYYSWCDLNLTKAATLVKQLETPIQNSNMAPFIRITRHAIQAVYHWNAGEIEICEKNARQGLAIAEETGIQSWNFMLYAQITWAKLTSDDVVGAEQNLDIMAGLLDTRRFLDAAHYHYQRFVAALHKNNNNTMLEHAKLALSYSNKAGSPWAISLTLTAVGQANYANGNKQAALNYLAQVQHYGKTFRSSNTQLQALLQEAEIELDLPLESASTEKLKMTLEFCRKHGWVNWPWWCRRIVSRLFIRALENDIEAEYVQQLIKKRRFIPETVPVHLENWPWTIKIYTLGRFNILIKDQPLQFTGKSQKRPLELLRALISLGGRDVNINKLMDCIWPYSEADAAHASFNMALKRLRTLLRDHQAIQLREGLLSLDPHYCWVDAWAFERLAGKKINHPEKSEKALALYHGPLFSSELCLGWCLPMRQRLHRKYLATALSLGQYWETRQLWQRAVNCYLNGLAVDEFTEFFYQRLMLCYKKMGLINEARRIYEQFIDLTDEYPEMKPNQTSLQIYQSL